MKLKMAPWLFHGPALAFKDFGSRFMAQCLAAFRTNGRSPSSPLPPATPVPPWPTPSTAWRDWGGDPLPQGKISPLQEALSAPSAATSVPSPSTVTSMPARRWSKMPSTMGAQDRDWPQLRQLHQHQPPAGSGLLLLRSRGPVAESRSRQAVISVPSGNFVTSPRILIAKALGLPVKRFIAATNASDTVPL